MNKVKDLLIEIGTEEMPPKALRGLSEHFVAELAQALNSKGLTFGAQKGYASPRRLAVLIQDLAVKQQDQFVERKGPALSAAFDAQGKPTRAALGFAKSCKVAVERLEKLESKAGSWLVYRETKPGARTTELLPELIEHALQNLPIPRRMRWGTGETEFVRPVHWVVFLFGDELLETPVLGMKPVRETQGHRFHRPDALRIYKPADYEEILKTQGKVLADFNARKQEIREQVEHLAQTLKGRVVLDEALLDEVTALVEWPVTIAGSFATDFLKIPPEVLISTMQENQKYFPIVDSSGNLLPHFIVVSNIESKDPDKVREGNERVIRPRFRDAEFFWQQDRNSTLASHRPSLKEVIFQRKLGTLFDKSERLVALIHTIAELVGVDLEQARRAAELCKCDLMTTMVNEFPRLQGVMGRYYAQHDHESEAVATAIDEHYMPRQAGDALPRSALGQCLALADRLDTLVGIFAIGQKPSGIKDPFGLRRAALGVLRILIEGRLNLDLEALIRHAAERVPLDIDITRVMAEVFDYSMDRLKAYYSDRDIGADVIDAVQSTRPTRPLDFDQRIHAVQRFRELPEAKSLTTTNKRIRNILRQFDGAVPTLVDDRLLRDAAEHELYRQLTVFSRAVEPLFDQGDYEQGLLRLAGLRAPVDRFFDEVLVMTEESNLKSNRIALLNRLSQLFMRTADLSRLQN